MSKKKKKLHVIKNIVTANRFEVFPEEDLAKMKKRERKDWLKYEKSLEGAERRIIGAWLNGKLTRKLRTTKLSNLC